MLFFSVRVNEDRARILTVHGPPRRQGLAVEIARFFPMEIDPDVRIRGCSDCRACHFPEVELGFCCAQGAISWAFVTVMPGALLFLLIVNIYDTPVTV